MDQEWINLIQENNELLKENLELSQRNTKKIKRIQSFMRRAFIARIMYWVLLILVAAGALYAIKPYVEKVIGTYNTLQGQIQSTSEVINNPISIFKDVGILNKFIDSE